jgi:hypothetical protein
MKTIATKEKQENQLKEAIGKVNTWKNKFHFSFATLLFVSFLLITYSLNSFLGNIPTFVLSFVVLIFIQQSIRSYNYLKFHFVTYRSLEMLHKMVDDVI